MAGTAPDFLVRFPAPPPSRGTVGVGFVVGAEHVLTCAHVINAALGRDLLQQDKAEHDEIVTLRLPMSSDAIREARPNARGRSEKGNNDDSSAHFLHNLVHVGWLFEVNRDV
ncbi:MAG: hypothetical protein ACT4NY_26255 [Pseudonocardiales bacterium]